MVEEYLGQDLLLPIADSYWVRFGETFWLYYSNQMTNLQGTDKS